MARLKLSLLLTLGILISGCSTGWLGASEDEAPLPGERISIMATEANGITVSPGAESELPVRLPAATTNNDWVMRGGNAANNAGHVTLSKDLSLVWDEDIGAGSSSDDGFNLSSPIFAINGVFVMDAELTVSAYKKTAGERVWRTSLMLEEEEESVANGGLAFGDRRLFATTGFGQAFALNPLTGQVLWRQSVGSPVRAAPTVYDGRLFVTTIDNQVMALDSRSGEILWQYQGISETTTVLGGAGAVVERDVVVVPLSTGEILAFRTDNGRVLWIDSLAARKQVSNQLSNITDIRARPVIDEGRVYAVSHGGRLGAFDLTSGRRIWAREIGGIESPVIAGNYLFVVTNDQQLICLTKREGRVLWIQQLPQFTDPEDRRGAITWSGPVAASDHLLLTGSNGQVIIAAAENGAIQQTLSLAGRFTLPPIVAQERLIVLGDSGELSVFQ